MNPQYVAQSMSGLLAKPPRDRVGKTARISGNALVTGFVFILKWMISPLKKGGFA
jgi:hypothetical protein